MEAARNQIGKYRIEEKIGAGSFGEVFRAFDTQANREVALKVLRAEYSNDRAFVRRFEEEFEALKRAADCGGVTRVYETAQIDGRFIIAMQYIEGESLRKKIEGRAFATAEQKLTLLESIAKSLDCLHAKGLVHRDIKPENVLVSSDGDVYLVDLGLAKSASGSLGTASATFARSGTAAYRAPEVASGIPTKSADLYSLGAVAYELLVGQPAFDEKNLDAYIHAHQNKPVPVPHAVNQAISRPMSAALIRMMAKQPAKRFSSAAEFVRALRAQRAPMPVPAIVGAVAGVLVLAGAIVVLSGALSPRPAAPSPTPAPADATRSRDEAGGALRPSPTTTKAPEPTVTALPPTATPVPPTPTPIPPSATPRPTSTPLPTPTRIPPPEFTDNFDRGLKQGAWTQVFGVVGANNGALTLIDASKSRTGVISFGDVTWDNYAIDFDVSGLWDQTEPSLNRPATCADRKTGGMDECYDPGEYAGMNYAFHAFNSRISLGDNSLANSRLGVLLNVPEGASEDKGNCEAVFVGMFRAGSGRIDFGERQQRADTRPNPIGQWTSVAGVVDLQNTTTGLRHYRLERRGNDYALLSEGKIIVSGTTVGGRGRPGFWFGKMNTLPSADPRSVPRVDNVVVSPLPNP